MPLYEYECDACHHRFERIQKFSDPPVDVCPNCGKGPVKKLLSSPAIQFKGSGWYITDYARKSSTESSGKTSSGSSSDTSSTPSTSTSSSSDTGSKSSDKPETKS
jgi:putative FmdB family regulatory protein